MMDLQRISMDLAILERERYHSLLFKGAALWNCIIGLTFIVLPRIDMAYFSLAGDVPPPPTLLWADSFFLMVIVVGLLLYAISMNPDTSKGFIPVVMFEKVMIFAFGLAYFLIGEASILVLGFVTGDLILGILFSEHLMALRRMT